MLKLTYAEIIALEPRIGAIIKRLRPSRSWREYECAKVALSGLVGYHAAIPELSTPAVYETVMTAAADRLKL